MGEDKIVDFESLNRTFVFWNIDDYPIPVDGSVDLSPIFGNIFKALRVMGFVNEIVDVILYSEQEDNCDKKEIELFDHSVPQASIFRVPDITLHIIRRATMMGPGPVKFLVIAKPASELDRVLQCLKSRRHNVVLFQPPQAGEECLFSVDSILNSARLLGGGKPRYKYRQSHRTYQYDIDVERTLVTKEDVSKTVDFSERIPTVKGPRTAVFWDAVASPFPLGSTPDEIFNSISTALVERQLRATLSAYAPPRR